MPGSVPACMVYATSAQMIARFGEDELVSLTDRDGSAEGIVGSVLDVALNDATALINGYLAGRYTLPLVTAPEMLERLSCDIARYGLYDNGASEQVSKRFDDAVRFLEMVAAGRITLGITTEGDSPVSNDLPAIESDGAVFNRRQSTGFI
ncbi:DUF1320 family protein [Shewanella sp. D64]|uniref:gp436 family protein n=1 Tax=unclassified Shewanella TaxID=196818 RepID=UPI0022BA3E4F|nr:MULTISPECIES: phage protein Gp36 family protein [unclassified Shewanella]MEC4724520.1 DUF1320 family protein [Shewanella sp. D64]MEC4736703.1 DUF1320 family protein [Shewanella sp. E94]WBJ94628.1 DUF1320 family protein [Shewanella sp. MTB7]